MAGTLTVQNLQGPTSGANANKVIIPSGHTFIPSSGQIIQTVQFLRAGATGSNSSSRVDVTTSTYVDLMSKSITTTVANSKVRVLVGLVGYNGSSELRGSVRLYRDSTIIDGDQYAMYSATSTMCNFIVDNIDSPSASAGTTLTYKIQGNNIGSNSMMYLYQDGGGASSNSITLQEIAP